jgi:hypothetical protein
MITARWQAALAVLETTPTEATDLQRTAHDALVALAAVAARRSG